MVKYVAPYRGSFSLCSLLEYVCSLMSQPISRSNECHGACSGDEVPLSRGHRFYSGSISRNRAT